MMTICRCFAVLVVSGQGQSCNKLRDTIRDTLLQPLPSGQSKAWLHKFGRKQFPDQHAKIRAELALQCSYLYHTVPKHFYESFQTEEKSNKSPSKEDIFKMTLEGAMSSGRWNGTMGAVS